MSSRSRLFLLLLLFLSYQVFRSYESLHESNYTFSTAKLATDIEVLVMADLYDHTFGSDNGHLVSKIQSIAPDLILMVGDFINDYSEDSENVLCLISQISAIAPVYFSLGNHELDYMNRTGEDLVSNIQKVGATVLDRTYEDIEINGEPIRIGGMYDYAFALDDFNSTNPETMNPEVYQFLTDFQDTDSLKIMLAHRPDSFIFGEASKTWDIDLVVSGHVHGGQVVLPFLGGLWAPEQEWFPTYVHGMYEKDALHLFITSGLGSQTQMIPRFNNPPELATISLKSLLASSSHLCYNQTKI